MTSIKFVLYVSRNLESMHDCIWFNTVYMARMYVRMYICIGTGNIL